MVYKVHWLRRASNELYSIYRYYSDHASPRIGTRRVGKILDAVELLYTMPQIGRPDGDFRNVREYRYIVTLSYRIYYFIENNDIFIASIWDCRQGGKAIDTK
ncbi:MAG: type II toxin-antitoxin system RelE/ParE family toxin [Bacteroidales bacterium]|nr:type II toxin-antitoxin system RelE/ParE family toxin [Bacteroidales bacterium]